MTRNNAHRDFKADAFESLARGLGLVALSYNDLLISLSGLFNATMKIQNQLITDTIWHVIRSDRDQVNLIASLAASKASGISIPQNIRVEMKWATDRTNELIDARNDLLHSPFVSSGGRPPISFHLGTHQRALKFDGKDVIRECEWFYTAATVTRDWVEHLEIALTEKSYTLPQRPPWAVRPSSKKSAQKIK